MSNAIEQAAPQEIIELVNTEFWERMTPADRVVYQLDNQWLTMPLDTLLQSLEYVLDKSYTLDALLMDIPALIVKTRHLRHYV
jgi:hypothetical protein